MKLYLRVFNYPLLTEMSVMKNFAILQKNFGFNSKQKEPSMFIEYFKWNGISPILRSFQDNSL